MRLWHKDLIPVLPKAQLISQWRECVAISAKLAKYAYPNHILVNRMMQYPLDHFYTYTMGIVVPEMKKRGYRIEKPTIDKFLTNLSIAAGRNEFRLTKIEYVYNGWHNTRYLLQCMMNLEEKYDCGGIADKDWFNLVSKCRNLDKFCEETYQSLFV